MVSLATGTKSLGKSKYRDDGLLLNDCHAEVLARRGLIKSLMKEIHLLHSDQPDKALMLQKDSDGKIKMREDVLLHLYVSEAPCGDSSLLVKSETG